MRKVSKPEYHFYLPLAVKEENQAENGGIINKALEYLLDRVTGFKYIGETDSLIVGGGKTNTLIVNGGEQRKIRIRKILIIHSSYEGTLKKYLKQILKLGYGKFQEDTREDTRLGNQRYLFIDNGNRTFLFDSLLSILTSLNLAVVETPERIFHGIHKIQQSFDKGQKQRSSKDLQDHIEKSCLPSGAEEIQEMVYRDISKAHLLFGSIKQSLIASAIASAQKDIESYALRLLLGAFLSGDINLEMLKRTILQISPQYKFPVSVRQCLKNNKEDLEIDCKNLSRLRDYLVNRNILFIEDQLIEHYWDTVLPVLFGSTDKGCRIKERKGKQKIGQVNLWYAKNAREALERYGEDLKKFDIILLDLLSSEKGLENPIGHHHSAQTLSTLGLAVKELAEKIKGFYSDQASKGDLVPSALPQVVIFSFDSTGVTTRALLKDLGAVDYFFKKTQGEAHKRAYYASFRNVLIKALKDTASHVLGIPYSDKFNKFDVWLRQFFPKDRPIILRLMKHFRYYSAMSIVKVLDSYLSKEMPLKEGMDVVSYKGNNASPNRILFSYLGRENKSGPATLALFSKTDWANRCIQIAKKKKHKGQEDYEPFKTYDKLISLLRKEFIEGLKENLRIFVIDDVVLSGGQLETYLWKLINRKLREKLGNKWNECCKFFLPLQKEDLNRNWIEIHAIGVIGLAKPKESTLDIKYLQDMLEPGSIKIALPPKYSWMNKDPRESLLEKAKDDGSVHFYGVLKIPLCQNKTHKEPEDSQHSCNCEKVIPVHVHIADLNQNVGMVCEKEGISYSKLCSTLKEYTYITSPRENEYPCDFEPLGWKECGGLLSTYANCPGDTLPIIWGDRGKRNVKNGHVEKWEPLFHRFFNPMDGGGKGDNADESTVPHRCKKLDPDKGGNCCLRPDLDAGGDRPPCKSEVEES